MRSWLFDPTACLQVLAPWGKNNLLEEEGKRREKGVGFMLWMYSRLAWKLWKEDVMWWKGWCQICTWRAGLTRSILSQQLENVDAAKAAIPDWCTHKCDQWCLCIYVWVCTWCVLTYAQACILTWKSVLSWEFRLQFSHLAFHWQAVGLQPLGCQQCESWSPLYPQCLEPGGVYWASW